MTIRLETIRVGACFKFKAAIRRVTGITRRSDRGFDVQWEYADGKKRGGRLNGEQWCHYFAKEAIAEVARNDGGTRTLLSGREVVCSPETTGISITTHCPAKWAFVDLETGEVWAHDGSGLVRASDLVRAELRTVVDRISA